MKICIIGNSKRLSILESNLIQNGFTVTHYENCSKIDKEINDDFIVLPVPTVNKNGYINTDDKVFTVDDLFGKIAKRSKVITCGLEAKSHTTIDLNLREDFAYLNAVPTAEGAIYYAIQNTDKALFESKILITGFGRVAKLLADRLRLLCKNVTVGARSQKDLSYAEAIGFNCLNLKALEHKINNFDIIFQTVPHRIITGKTIENMDKGTIIIELSSKSIGTDFSYAESLGIKVIHAPALPEKIAPITAGNILTKSVLSIIDEYSNSIYSE